MVFVSSEGATVSALKLGERRPFFCVFILAVDSSCAVKLAVICNLVRKHCR